MNIPIEKINKLNRLREQTNAQTTGDIWHKFASLLPLFSIYLIASGFISIQLYYSNFDFQPMQHFSFSELVIVLFQNLMRPFFIFSCILLFLFTVLYIVAEIGTWIENTTKNKILRLLLFLLIAAIAVYVLSFIEIENPLVVNGLIAISSNYSQELTLTFFLLFGILIFYFSLKDHYESKSQLPLFKRYHLYFLLASFLLYTSLYHYYQGSALLDYRLNRNIYLKTKNEVILPYDSNKFVIGNTTDKYFVFSSSAHFVQVINSSEIEKVIFFRKYKHESWDKSEKK